MSFAPYAHQAATAAKLRDTKRILLRHEVGVGKTISTLLHCDQVPGATLVLAPRAVVHAAWVRDAEHFPGLSVVVYHGSKRAKILANANGQSRDRLIVVTTHETFRRDVNKLAEFGFSRFVVDESSKLKNRDSAISEAAIKFSSTVDRVILLSGTPAPNSPIEYFPQMACIDPQVLGLFWGMVREYFVPERKTIIVRGQRREVVARFNQTEQQRKRFAEKLAPYIDSLTKRECLTLPPVTTVVRYVELSEQESIAYSEAEESLRLFIKGGTGSVDRIRAEALLGKLRQITGGSVYNSTGGVTDVGRSKLDELLSVLEEIGEDEPVVMWAEYRHEIDRIAEATGATIIDGRTKDAASIVAAFQRGDIKRLVCHPAACGHGITLTRACYAVFYSLSFSAELFEQAKGRLDRAGQTRPITNIVMLASDTVDVAVYRALTSKNRTAQSVIASILEAQSDPMATTTGRES